MYSRMIRNIDRPILYNATTTKFNFKNCTYLILTLLPIIKLSPIFITIYLHLLPINYFYPILWLTPHTLTSYAPHVTLSPRHSLDATIDVSGFANPVKNSKNLPLTKWLPSKILISTGFAPTVELILDRPNVIYSPIASPKPLPSITIIPLHLHPTYLHNPLFLHLHCSPHHPTLHPKPYPSHPQLSHCYYHLYYPHSPIPCY